MRSQLGLIAAFLALAGAGCSFFGTTANQTKRGVGEAVNTAQQVGDIVSGASAIATKLAADRKLAIARAAELYRQAIADERDLSKGPCLSDSAIPDWVVDVAHNPRTDVDDKPENQCAAFRAGAAHHFVELDLSGQLISAQ